MLIYWLNIIVVLLTGLSTALIAGCIAIKILPISITEHIVTRDDVNSTIISCLRIVKSVLAASIIWLSAVIIGDYIYLAQEQSIQETLSRNESMRKFIELLGIVFADNQLSRQLLLICLLAAILQYVVISNTKFKASLGLT